MWGKIGVLCAAAVVVIGATMGWFWSRNKSVWDLASRTPPWGSKRSIYAHISEHVQPGTTGLTEGGESLPDETADGQIRFAAGAMDGVFGGTSDQAGDGVAKVHRAIKRVLADGDDRGSLKHLYDALLEEPALGYVDPLLEALAVDRRIDRSRLGQLGVWLAKGAPDREPVKVGLVLIGLRADEADRDLLLTLGRHDEFTLYAAVALMNLRNGEQNLFELAQQVDGWGRVQIVPRFADTRDPKIKGWMLREGYKNSIMYEYLAYTCATAGGLRAELAKDSVDAALVDGAGDLIQALIAGGPAEDMDDYADGAAVAELYLRHLGPEPKKLGQLITVGALVQFLDEKGDWKAREARGWTPDVRAKLREQCIKVKNQDSWAALIRQSLGSSDRQTFGEADQAARVLGIDAWDEHFTRLQAGDDNWYAVMQTTDPARIDRVIALAEERIPLDKVASGPGKELGMGSQWAHHSHLDFVLQDLRRFPGKGWSLIRAGVRSPVIRNRHMALRVFSKWGKASWPGDAEATLRHALKDEPDDTVREELQTVLDGKVIEEAKAQLNEEQGSDH